MYTWKKFGLILFTVTFIVCLGVLSWFAYDFNHPYLCSYTYVDANGYSGNAKICSTNDAGISYCRTSIKRTINVQNYKKECGRK